MTRGAIARKILGHVIGIERTLVIALMAGEAIHRRAGVTIVRVTLIARYSQVRAIEREARAIVIERRRTPRNVTVAEQTVSRIIVRNMIGIRRALKIILMAREAILRRACEATIDVAARAIHGNVRAL